MPKNQIWFSSCSEQIFFYAMLVWGLWTVRMMVMKSKLCLPLKLFTVNPSLMSTGHFIWHHRFALLRARVCDVQNKLQMFPFGCGREEGKLPVGCGEWGGWLVPGCPPAPFLSQFWLLYSGSDAVSHTAERIHPSNFTQRGRFITSSALIQLPQVLMPSWPARTGPVQAEPDRNRTKPSGLILWPRSRTCSNNGFSSDQKPGFLCLIPKERKV